MANSEVGMSSVAAQASGRKYQVFLNFRGPDTRLIFTDFLYHGLKEAGFRVFRDSEELYVGEVIGKNLLSAIDDSIIYIPIFSQTYASSKWCLRELARIVDNVSKSDGKKDILPIFYLVRPDDVKLKNSCYSDALLKHENNYPNEVEVWRKALKEVGGIKGSTVGKDNSQAETVKSVVQRVLQKLKKKEKSVPHLVGLHDQIKALKELLDVKGCDVCLVGIYGMGGLGKTTIAKVVFNQIYSHFGTYCCFLENVRERSSRKEGIVQLQKNLLYEIVGSRFAENIQDTDEGMATIGEILCNRKVLVVLDDVDKSVSIKNLIGNFKLHKGSRIIVTTREEDILEVRGFEGEIRKHEMQKMKEADC